MSVKLPLTPKLAKGDKYNYINSVTPFERICQAQELQNDNQLLKNPKILNVDIYSTCTYCVNSLHSVNRGFFAI